MSTNILGIRNNNTIIPLTASTKRTKEIALTVTSAQTGWATTRAVGIFYADSAGTWRLKLNISGTFTAATITTLDVDITGVVFKSGIQQACSGLLNNVLGNYCYAGSNVSTLSLTCTSSSNTSVKMSGDVELESNPTAYTTAANMEGVVAVDVFVPNASTTPGLLSYYAEGSFNTYLVDGTLKSAAVLCYYVRVGNLVTLTLKANTLTTAATTGIKITSTDSASTYTWPAYLKPARDIGCIVRGFDNGATPTTKSALCIVRASGNGVIDLYADITGAAFTAGNVDKGTSVDFTFSYNLL